MDGDHFQRKYHGRDSLLSAKITLAEAITPSITGAIGVFTTMPMLVTGVIVGQRSIPLPITGVILVQGFEMKS